MDVVNIGLVWSLCLLVHLISCVLHDGVTGTLQGSAVSPSLYPCSERDMFGKLGIKRQNETSSLSKIRNYTTEISRW